jgi:YfiH family protein
MNSVSAEKKKFIAGASASALKKPSALKKQRAKRDRESSSPRPPKTSTVKILTSERLAEIPWLLHGFSTRQGGVSQAYGGRQLNLGVTAEDEAENVEHNRARLLCKLNARKLNAHDEAGGPFKPSFGLSGALLLLKQVHSAVIHRVYGPRGPQWAPLRNRKIAETPEQAQAPRLDRTLVAGDGMITNSAGVLLAVKVADCFPVIVADRKRKAVGIFHAGWRGTVQRIVEKGIGEMRRQLGCDPRNLLAVIGPGIGACCYEIGEEVENQFDSQFAYSKELFEDVFDSWSLKTKYPMLFLNQRAPGHGDPAMSRHLDLVKANWCQLLDAGVPTENIQSMNLCTACHTDLFFSYRREHVTGRMLAVVGIKPDLS